MEDYYVERGGQTLTHCSKCAVEFGIGCSPYCRDAHAPLRDTDAARFDAVVIYQTPDGQYRVPGDSQTRTTQMYDRLGYTRIECKSLGEVRRLTAKMNAADRRIVERRTERKQQEHEERQARDRGELRQAMQSMSPAGRAVAMAAMERNNRKSIRSYDPGSHFEFAEYNASNRERDSKGRK
jgi:hypothetical protein